MAIGKFHPNFFEFIAEIKKQQEKFEIDFIKLGSGEIIKRRKLKSMEMDKKIKLLKDRFLAEEITVFEYIDRIAILLKLQA